MPVPAQVQPAEIRLHGHRVSYRAGGSGPVIVLVHGVTSSSQNWEPVLPLLTERFTVVAPDLLGHGASAKPQGDYSLGAYACLVRDLLLALGHERATIVGHSLGGGVAMQFAYQFPERVERLVLVSSGGLGHDVHPLLRAAALPGSELVLPLITARPLLEAGATVAGMLGRVGLTVGSDISEMGRGLASLSDLSARQAFVHTIRAVIDPTGQRVDATDRLYLAESVPTLLVWGARDRIIPAEHGRRAEELMPGSRLEVFEDAGHFPHHDEPIRFFTLLRDFVDATDPADVDLEQIRELVLEHSRIAEITAAA
jgi:pimeloyl-ACP methyl ester carboxylesterase